MKVIDFIKLLEKHNPQAEVVISRDVDSHGFGALKYIKTGVFVYTDYGNDFYEDTDIIVDSKDKKAICLISEESLLIAKAANEGAH